MKQDNNDIPCHVNNAKYLEGLVPFRVEIVEDDRSLGNPVKNSFIITKHCIDNGTIPCFSKFYINKGISDVLLVIDFAVPILHVGDSLGFSDLGIYYYYSRHLFEGFHKRYFLLGPSKPKAMTVKFLPPLILLPV